MLLLLLLFWKGIFINNIDNKLISITNTTRPHDPSNTTPTLTLATKHLRLSDPQKIQHDLQIVDPVPSMIVVTVASARELPLRDRWVPRSAETAVVIRA